MKLKWPLIAVAAAVLISAGNLVAALHIRKQNMEQAQQTHAAAHEQYLQLLQKAEASTVTVTEQGAAVGTFTLAQLGLLEPTLAAAEALHTDTDRLPPEDFQQLSYAEQMAWYDSYTPQNPEVQAVMTEFDSTAVTDALNRTDRTAAEDAFLYFADGAYHVRPEVYGTQLQTEAVEASLREAAAAITVTPQAAAAVTLEITDTDCYILPAVTAQAGTFDFAAALEQNVQHVTVTVNFHGSEETVAVGDLLYTDKRGAVQVDAKALTRLVNGWAEAYAVQNTPYLFDSYKEGLTPIPFLLCDYAVDTAALETLLKQQLPTLESAVLEAPWLCFRDGEAFAIADTYVAVDIKNQHMVYYKDGALIVCTDVVTGHPNGHRTPRGFWAVRNRLPDQLLVGPDYAQFVRWWVGVHGAYGIHDASWRSEFGGELYLTDGSHGCINTPDGAMELLYETVEVGTPVLFFG